MALLRETFARVIRERRPQLVTLVGVPGIGKSRLVFELFQTIETGVHGLVFWRHGRSLPYGDGVTFWALAEMVKAQAAILESDAPEAASEKLRHAVARYVTASDTAWVVRHLRPLVGLEAEEQLAGDRRGETFAAWRRLFEALAEERPLVLVFEDLHWADEALLDFVDYLVEWATGVPVLVLCTARPELLERRSSWGGGKVNSSTILLSPLSAEETAVLVHSLLGLSTLDADVRSRLLESAGGNPLYAEEFTRMLTARPADVVLPETVQGIIAARLDTLPSEEKELLQIAAVLGRVFWLGALGHDRWRVEERLHSLERKEFVSRSRRSSVAEEDEYTFRHALVREVAYEQIPKAERSDKHRAAGEWIESLGRPEDHAEMLAHHYAAALDYASGAGQDTDLLAERGRLALREAGDRAFGLNAFPHAARFYERALDLWPAEEQGRAQLLFRYGRALWQAERKGIDILLEAVERLVASADRGSAAEAEVLLAQVEWLRGHREEANAHLERAVDLVRDLPGSRSKAVVLASLARSHALAGAYDDAIRLGREALTLAEELLLDEVQAYALNYIGMARVRGGDLGGTADLERSVEIARAANSPEVARSCNNLGYELFSLGHLERSSELLAEAVRHAARFGEIALGRFTRAGPQLHLQLRQGKWDDVLEVANELIAETEAGSPDYQENSCRHARALIRLARGDVDGALADCERRLELAREIADPQALVPALGFVARVFVEVGRLEEAAALADELEVVKTRYRATLELPDLAVVLIALGRVEALRAAVDAAEGTRWAEAVQHYLTGEFQRAADVFADMGVRRDEADARLRAAEKLAGEGRRAEADEQLQKALAFYRSVGATRYIRQGEALLAAAS